MANLKRRANNGSLGVGNLIWTSNSSRMLPIWDHPDLIDSAWKGSRRYWVGLSLLGLLLTGYDARAVLASEVGNATSLADQLLDVGCSVTVLFFCLWQLWRTIAQSPVYLQSSRIWQRFNAWCRINDDLWSHIFTAALLAVYACQVYGLRSTNGNGIATRTLKLAVSFQELMEGHFARIFTAPVLHANPFHILFNVIWLLFAARWIRGVAPRAVLPLVLGLSAWSGSCFVVLAPESKPAVGISSGLFGLNAFMVVVWLRTRSLPPFLGVGLALWFLTASIGEVLQGSDASSSAPGHAGGFLVGFILGMLLVRPGAQLPITTNRFVNFAGNACAVIMLALCALVSLNLSGVSWAQW